MLRCAERDSCGQAGRLKEAGVRYFTTILGCGPELPLLTIPKSSGCPHGMAGDGGGVRGRKKEREIGVGCRKRP